MKPTITFQQKNSESGKPIEILNSFTIDAGQVKNTTFGGKKTSGNRNIYVRIGFLNGTPFISQRGNGAGGAGDIISLNIEESIEIPIQFDLYERLSDWADKNNLKIK